MNKLWNMGKYIQITLSSETYRAQASITSGSMSSSEFNSLPLCERALVHRVHVLAEKMTV